MPEICIDGKRIWCPPHLPGPAWTAAAIARRVRDDALLRQVRAGRSPHAPQLPKWLRDASPFNA